MSKCEDVFIVLWYFFCANKKKERKKEKRKKKKERKRKRRKKKDSTFPSSLPSFSRLPFLEFLFRLSPPPSKSNSERKKNSVPFRLCQCRYLHVFSLHFFTTSTAASLEKDVLRPFLGHETVSKTWWHNTRSGLSKKFTICGGLVPFLFPFLYSSFRMYNAPTFRAAQQCHWRARHCCIGRVLDIVGLGHYNNNNKGLVPRVLFLFSVSKKNPTIQTTLKKTRLEQNPVQSRLFQLGPPVQPSSPEPRK